MKVDIWSDVRCPFCYIGKHKFEKALEQFPHKDGIEVIWHSFELDPGLKTDTETDAFDHLAEKKAITREQAIQMTQYAKEAAKEAGLDLHFEKAVVAGSFHAHRLIQLAKVKGLGQEAEEQLFKAHFTDGKNIDDKEVLLQTGMAIGLEKEEVEALLSTDAYAEAVRQDERQAQALGIKGVPFFVFNDKYAVSGAREPEVFLQALEQSWNEQAGRLQVIKKGASCSTEGDCN